MSLGADLWSSDMVDVEGERAKSLLEISKLWKKARPDERLGHSTGLDIGTAYNTECSSIKLNSILFVQHQTTTLVTSRHYIVR